MDRTSVETAIEAANVALQGKRSRDTRRLTSIELRQVDSQRAVWEVVMAACAGIITFALAVALLLH